MTPTAQVWLCTATESARRAMRALAMALRVPPTDLVVSPGTSPHPLRALHEALSARPASVAVLDLDALAPVAPTLLSVADRLPDPSVRSRVLLLRESRALWPTDQAWASELGFAGLWAQIDAAELAREDHPLPAALARGLGLPPLPAPVRQQYFSAMQVVPDPQHPRGVIRQRTGLAAETLCLELASQVKLIDRTWRLGTYPACQLGTEAVDWLAARFKLGRARAVEIGLALQKLGLLQHVVHEQPFADAPNFYRPTHSSALERFSPGDVHALLMQPGVVDVRDRSYLGRNYPACWVGAATVASLAGRLRIRPHEAEILLNRLMGFGLIEHVTRDHPVRDGNFYYRFVS